MIGSRIQQDLARLALIIKRNSKLIPSLVVPYMQKIISPLILDFPDDKLRKIFLTVDPGVACGLAAWRFECTLRNIIESVNPNAFLDQSDRIGQDLKARADFYENQWEEVIQFYLLKEQQPLSDEDKQKYSLQSLLPHFIANNQSEDFLIHLFHIRDLQLHGRRPYPNQNSDNELSEFVPYHYLACRDFELILAGTQILKSFIFRINPKNNQKSTIGKLLSQKNLSMQEETVVQQIQSVTNNAFPSAPLKAAELFFLFSDIFFEKHITRVLEQLNSKGLLPPKTIVNLKHGINCYKKLLNKATKLSSTDKNDPIKRLLEFIPENQIDDFLSLMGSIVNQLRHCGKYNLPTLKNETWHSQEFQSLNYAEQAQKIWTYLGKTLIEITIKLANELDDKHCTISITKGRISRKGSYKN